MIEESGAWSDRIVDLCGRPVTKDDLDNVFTSARKHQHKPLPMCNKCGKSLIHPTPLCDNRIGVAVLRGTER